MTGEPFLVVPQGSQPSTSPDGTLVYMDASAHRDSELVWFDDEGTILGTIGQPQTDMESPAISPDGKRVAVVAEEDNDWDIWVHDESGKGRITFDKGRETYPRWSADGDSVLYNHPIGPSGSIYATDSAAGGDRTLLRKGHQVSIVGDRLVFRIKNDDTKGDLYTASLGDGGDPEVFLQTPANEQQPELSPDGRFVAYVSDESGRSQVYVRPFPDGAGKWQVSVANGEWPKWSPTGDRLYYTSYSALLEVEVRTEPTLRLGTPRQMFDHTESAVEYWEGFAIAPDGKRFVGIRQVARDDDEDVVEGIHVVENWLAEFGD